MHANTCDVSDQNDACSEACAAWLQVQIPGPLGMILVGIAVGNINNGHLVKGLPSSWSKELRAIALALIFLRSGLELDLRVSRLQLGHHQIVTCCNILHCYNSHV